MKKLFAAILALAMVFAVCACGAAPASSAAPASDAASPAAESSEAAPAAEPIVLRFSTAATAESNTTRAMQVFKETVEKNSNGQLVIDLYPGSSLFAQDAEVEAVINGDLDMAQVGAQFVAPYFPKVSMFAAAYTFKNVDHQDAVMNGELGQALYDELSDEVGVRVLGSWYGGARVLSLRYDDPLIKTPQDMTSVVLRMPNSDDWLFLGEALGANPTPLAFAEIYTSLQTGTIDAQDNPLPILETSKCYEVTKQIVLTNHVLDSVWPCINQAKWESLGPELQKNMMEGFEAARQFALDVNLESESKLVDFFRSEGITIVEPDLDAFMNYAADKYLNSEKSANWDMDLYNKIRSMG